MCLHGLLGHHETGRYVGVGQPLRDEGEHLGLALGQGADPVHQRDTGGGAEPGELGEEPLGHLGGEQRVAARHHPYRLGEFRCRR